MSVVIEIKRIEEIQAKVKDGKVSLQFETDLKPGDLARIVNLGKQGVPIQAMISSPQARMDLKFEEVKESIPEPKED